MFNIVIAGFTDCISFVNAVLIAQALEKKMHDFRSKIIQVDKQKSQQWIAALNLKMNWNYRRLPIIWHEIGLWGGKAVLIGGLAEFFEYCYDNFGFNSLSPTVDKDLYYQILQERAEYDLTIKMQVRNNPKYVRVCVSNCTHPMAFELTALLLNTKSIQWKFGCLITLYPNTTDQAELNKLKPLLNDLKGIRTGQGIAAVRIETDIKLAFYQCDVIILLDGETKQESESIMKWLWRNHKAMAEIGQIIEEQAKSNCFVINAAPDESIPLCFNCQVLADFAPKISARSIIAITADLGFETLMSLSKITKVRTRHMLAPAVWGEMGINRLVDIGSIRYIYYNKSEKDKEMRTLQRLINKHGKDKAYRKIKQRKRFVEKTFGRISYFSKIKATVDLIDIWFDLKEHTYISSTPVGILSDGSFGITSNLYFSQPATLILRTWVPCSDYNEPDETIFFKNMLTVYRYFLRKFDVGTRFDAIWLKNEQELDEISENLLKEIMTENLSQYEFFKPIRNKEPIYKDKMEYLFSQLMPDDCVQKRGEQLRKIKKLREEENKVYQEILGDKFH